MILLSQVSPGMNLSGRYLYFNKLIPATSPLCDMFVLGIYDAPGVPNNVLALRVVEGANQSRILMLSIQAQIAVPVWQTICNSSLGWDSMFSWFRTINLPIEMGYIPDYQVDPTVIYTWLPFIDFITVTDSEIDRPMIHLLDVDASVQPALVYDKMLSEVQRGDDLTDKVIVFDTDISFTVGTDAVTIGNPLPTQEGDSAWYIKYSLYESGLDRTTEVNAGVKNGEVIRLFHNGLWINNYIELNPSKSYEKFTVQQLPMVDDEARFLDSAFICSKAPKMTANTTLEIVKEAARRMHIPEPTSVEKIPLDLNTSDAQNSIVLLTALNQTVKNLAVLAPWPQLFMEARFTAVRDVLYGYNPSIRGFNLDKLCPSYDGVISPYIYALDQKFAIPQVFEKEFYDLTLGNTTDVSNVDKMVYRIVANHVCFSYDINGPVTFLYKTKYIFKDLTGGLKEFSDKDSDVCVFDPELAVLGTIVCFKASIGQDPTIESNLFDRYTEHLKSIIGSPSSTPINYPGE